MTNNVYSIKDSKIPGYTSLFTAVSDAIAIRQMKNLIDRDAEGYGKFTNDYSLYKVGIFDVSTGDINKDFVFVAEFSTIKDLA